MILAAIVGITTGVASARVGAVAGYGFGANVRAALYRKIQLFSFGNLDQFSVPSLITRLTNDCNQMSHAAMMSLRMGVRAPALFTFALIMAFNIDPRLARVFLVAIPILIVVFLIITNCRTQVYSDAGARRRSERYRAGRFDEHREIKTFVRVDHESVASKSNDSLMQTAFKAIAVVLLRCRPRSLSFTAPSLPSSG